jgi:hypothetical protein
MTRVGAAFASPRGHRAEFGRLLNRQIADLLALDYPDPSAILLYASWRT